jgi:hypothetical protein
MPFGQPAPKDETRPPLSRHFGSPRVAAVVNSERRARL